MKNEIPDCDQARTRTNEHASCNIKFVCDAFIRKPFQNFNETFLSLVIDCKNWQIFYQLFVSSINIQKRNEYNSAQNVVKLLLILE